MIKQIPWVEKYRPKEFNDIIGQDNAILIIKRFFESFNLGNLTKTSKKALVLHGPPGIGKTTLVHVISQETNSEIFELNASDLRNKDKLKSILRPAVEQQSLLKKQKVILIDEVDGISAVDRGGLLELLSVLTISKYPVIITANDIWKSKLSALRKKVELVELKSIKEYDVVNILLNILKQEDLFMNENVLKSIASRCRGDLRAAINDLQTFSRTRDPSLLQIDERNKEKSIFDALKHVLKEKPDKDMLGAFDSVNMNIDEIILWMEENICAEYSGIELVKAYELLAKVDLFKGRIYRKQYWRFLVYENIFLTYGISSVKKESKLGFTNYKRPSRILKIWLNNQRNAKKKSISQKYAQYVHVGVKRAMSEFPIIKQILKSNSKIQEELKLNEEEVEYVMR